MGASPIGIGRAAMLMVHFDKTSPTPFSYDAKGDWWPVNWDGDSGWLANRYGENPGRQGRDFLRCIGDVPNPGHGVDKGYMPDVKSFFVTAIPGRIPGDPKNSLFLSFLPAEVDTPGTPSNPVNAQDVPTGGTTNPNGGPPQDSNGCACTSVGSARTSSGEMLGGLAMLGLVIAGVGARRKKA
jgi:MYXO-CTERM domain-containing protein